MSGNPKFGQRYRAAFGWRAGSLRAVELESNEAEDSVVLFPSSWCCLNPQLTTLKKKGREDCLSTQDRQTRRLPSSHLVVFIVLTFRIFDAIIDQSQMVDGTRRTKNGTKQSVYVENLSDVRLSVLSQVV
ncbi:hypothetical protein QC764_0089790 [Podospora pseudoanserina]|uniref:Uncharacterized protein n=1 Tax=Podospora pseudoanserina TaxID=2609844 RepID=A0ABR0HSM8_9PEZI|nr:hypothetical protein QC764_0089790 [Podospora pseudoanserina]